MNTRDKFRCFSATMLMVSLCATFLFLTGCASDSKSPNVITEPKWTVINSLPRGQAIMRVHGASAGNIFAVADHGTLLHYNGVSWRLIETRTGDLFLDVWSPAPDVAYILSRTGTSKLLKYDRGSLQTVFEPPSGNPLVSIYGFSENNIVVGGVGEIHHFNGTTWTTKTINNGTYVYGVWGPSPDLLFAVDMDGSIFHYDGDTWTKHTEFPGVRFHAISGTAADNVYAVAVHNMVTGQTVFRYDGNTWSPIDIAPYDPDKPVGIALFNVWAQAPDNIYVVGRGGAIFNFDGADWEQTYDIPAHDYNAVWGTSADNVIIAGEYGILLRKNGNDWDEELGQYRGYLSGIWGTGPNNMYFGGSRISAFSNANLFHYDGTTLTPIDTGSTASIRALWGDASGQMFAATSVKMVKGEILRYDGANWSVNHVSDVQLLNLWGTDASNLFAVGYGADNSESPARYYSRILRYDGNNWNELAFFNDYEAIDLVSGASPTEVYFAGIKHPQENPPPPDSNLPLFYRYNGSTLEQLDAPDDTPIWSLFYLPGKGLYAGTLGGDLYLFNGVSWTKLAQVPVKAIIISIWASSENNVFLSTHSGVWRFNGTALSGPVYPVCGSGTRIWGTGRNNVYLVGYGGTIMRYEW